MNNKDDTIILLIGIIRKQSEALLHITNSVQETNAFTAEHLARIDKDEKIVEPEEVEDAHR